MSEPDYSQLARRTRELLRELEPDLASLAYSSVLADLIAQARREIKASELTDTSSAKSNELVATSPSALDAFLTRSVDTSKYDALFVSKGRLTDKCLAVLKIARDEFGIDGIGPKEISNILTRKFRVGQVHASNISRDLGAALEFVSRVDVDGQQRYLLTLKGETRVADALSEVRT